MFLGYSWVSLNPKPQTRKPTPCTLNLRPLLLGLGEPESSGTRGLGPFQKKMVSQKAETGRAFGTEGGGPDQRGNE